MNDKSDEAGNPNVLFLEDVLQAKWPEYGVRVICPITDPFVKHHGALGGLVRVYLTNKANHAQDASAVIDEMVEYCRKLSQVEAVYTGENAAKVLEMPADREGDIVVISTRNAVIGGRENEHDLSGLKGHRLRSHGGLSEQAIPLLRSGPVEHDPHKGQPANKAWRNFDVFNIALNY